MMRYGVTFLTWLSLAGAAFGQSTENYKAHVLIEATWGKGPGQYGVNAPEPEVYPHVFAVDDNEHIYVVDELNNRVQHYDEKGHFVGAIPIESFAGGTKLQKKQLGDAADRSVWIDALKIYSGRLYAVQRVYSGKPGGRVNVLRLEQKRFVKVEGSDVKKALGSGEVVDRDGDRWILSRGIDRKISPRGETLFEISHGLFDRAVVSNRGDYYLLSFIPRPDAHEPPAFDNSNGIRITRFSRVK